MVEVIRFIVLLAAETITQLPMNTRKMDTRTVDMVAAACTRTTDDIAISTSTGCKKRISSSMQVTGITTAICTRYTAHIVYGQSSLLHLLDSNAAQCYMQQLHVVVVTARIGTVGTACGIIRTNRA